MTKPEDQTPGGEPAPKPAVPSWVDEVLRAEPTPQPVTPPTPTQAAGDLRSSEANRPQPTPVPLREDGDLRIPDAPRPQPAPAPTTPRLTDKDADDWIARATGGTAKNPTVSSGPQIVSRPSDPVRDWPQPVHTPSSLPSNVPADIAQKRLVAGLLAIVLGGLGVHKFYLGMNTPGLIMLGVNLGVWVLAFLIGLLTLGLGLFITLPLAGLVSGAIGLLGLVEGVLYLTKSDGDFYREYVMGQKPWL
ncbi:NINE protein [Deinococcus sp. YIM 134068]|uniref:TM2 domain-containing protein n=1 Tax=Deinococcus lichenicola TaxID=3118910 RepID=UPI002F920DA0